MADYKAKARWSKAQELFMRDNWERLTDIQIAQVIGRTLKSIRRKRERMLLKKAMGRIAKDKQVSFDNVTENKP